MHFFNVFRAVDFNLANRLILPLWLLAPQRVARRSEWTVEMQLDLICPR